MSNESRSKHRALRGHMGGSPDLVMEVKERLSTAVTPKMRREG